MYFKRLIKYLKKCKSFSTAPFLFLWCYSPMGPTPPILRLLDDTNHTHTQTHIQTHTHTHEHTQTRYGSSGRVIGPSQRPCQRNTQKTNIHGLSGIRARNLSNREAVDPRLRPRGHRYRRGRYSVINLLAPEFYI
jgi:hypothetical protein